MAILIADTKLETETDAWYMFYADTKEDIQTLPTSTSTGSSYRVRKYARPTSVAYCIEEARQYIPNVAGSTAYTSNWVAELFGPSNLKKSTSGFPQRLYNSVLQGALGIDKDGIFGANTEKTVKEFQSAHGLTADGIAGAKTKAALAKRL